MKRVEIAFSIFLTMGAIFLFLPASTNADIIRIFNTGVDNYGALLPGASIDPHYSLITSADPRFPGPNDFVVVGSGYPLPERWFANNSTSQWIAPQATNFAGTGSPDALADGIYIYRTTFSLSGLDPLTAVLIGGWSTDNAGVDILINGVSTGVTTAIDQFQQGFASFSISSGFVPGNNTLDFVVRNGALGYWENSPTGLSVEITGTANPVPEPSTLLLLGSGLVGFIGFRRKFKK